MFRTENSKGKYKFKLIKLCNYASLGKRGPSIPLIFLQNLKIFMFNSIWNLISENVGNLLYPNNLGNRMWGTEFISKQNVGNLLYSIEEIWHCL